MNIKYIFFWFITLVSISNGLEPIPAKLVVLTFLLATAVTESESQNNSNGHELVNEVNHVQVGVYFEKNLK